MSEAHSEASWLHGLGNSRCATDFEGFGCFYKNGLVFGKLGGSAGNGTRQLTEREIVEDWHGKATGHG